MEPLVRLDDTVLAFALLNGDARHVPPRVTIWAVALTFDFELSDAQFQLFDFVFQMCDILRASSLVFRGAIRAL